MYILERLVFQGTEQCPQYAWKQLVMCENYAPLERVRTAQTRPCDWRITKTAFSGLPNNKKRRNAA